MYLYKIGKIFLFKNDNIYIDQDSNMLYTWTNEIHAETEELYVTNKICNKISVKRWDLDTMTREYIGRYMFLCIHVYIDVHEPKCFQTLLTPSYINH